MLQLTSMTLYICLHTYIHTGMHAFMHDDGIVWQRFCSQLSHVLQTNKSEADKWHLKQLRELGQLSCTYTTCKGIYIYMYQYMYMCMYACVNWMSFYAVVLSLTKSKVEHWVVEMVVRSVKFKVIHTDTKSQPIHMYWWYYCCGRWLCYVAIHRISSCVGLVPVWMSLIRIYEAIHSSMHLHLLL